MHLRNEASRCVVDFMQLGRDCGLDAGKDKRKVMCLQPPTSTTKTNEHCDLGLSVFGGCTEPDDHLSELKKLLCAEARSNLDELKQVVEREKKEAAKRAAEAANKKPRTAGSHHDHQPGPKPAKKPLKTSPAFEPPVAGGLDHGGSGATSSGSKPPVAGGLHNGGSSTSSSSSKPGAAGGSGGQHLEHVTCSKIYKVGEARMLDSGLLESDVFHKDDNANKFGVISTCYGSGTKAGKAKAVDDTSVKDTYLAFGRYPLGASWAFSRTCVDSLANSLGYLFATSLDAPHSYFVPPHPAHLTIININHK